MTELCEHGCAKWACPTCDVSVGTLRGAGRVGGIVCKHGNSGFGSSRCLLELNEDYRLRDQPVLEAREKARAQQLEEDFRRACTEIEKECPTIAGVVKKYSGKRGWQCPVCSAVWAPFVRKCEGCKA